MLVATHGGFSGRSWCAGRARGVIRGSLLRRPGSTSDPRIVVAPAGSPTDPSVVGVPAITGLVSEVRRGPKGAVHCWEVTLPTRCDRAAVPISCVATRGCDLPRQACGVTCKPRSAGARWNAETGCARPLPKGCAWRDIPASCRRRLQRRAVPRPAALGRPLWRRDPLPTAPRRSQPCDGGALGLLAPCRQWRGRRPAPFKAWVCGSLVGALPRSRSYSGVFPRCAPAQGSRQQRCSTCFARRGPREPQRYDPARSRWGHGSPGVRFFPSPRRRGGGRSVVRLPRDGGLGRGMLGLRSRGHGVAARGVPGAWGIVIGSDRPSLGRDSTRGWRVWGDRRGTVFHVKRRRARGRYCRLALRGPMREQSAGRVSRETTSSARSKANRSR